MPDVEELGTRGGGGDGLEAEDPMDEESWRGGMGCGEGNN